MTVETGFVLVDKTPGPTSHDIVDMVRKSCQTRRVGHAGTLDPPASGLLVIAVGPATRFLRYVQDLPKTYEVTAALGTTTTTLDAQGDVVEVREVKVAGEDIRDAARTFTGTIEQVPPAVSAVKVDGERAYKRARRGEEVELEARTVTIHDLDVVSASSSGFDLRVVCSSGTYIRSLVADIGEALGCGAHVATLRRTAIGQLAVGDAVSADEVSPAEIRGLESVLSLPHLDVDEATAIHARNGHGFTADVPDGQHLVLAPGGVIGVFGATGGTLRPMTVLGSS